MEGILILDYNEIRVFRSDKKVNLYIYRLYISQNFTVVNGTPVHMCYCEKQHGIVHSGHHNNQLLHVILLVNFLVTLLD